MVRGMHANGGLGKRMQRTKKESDAQANAARNEHAGTMADVSVFLYNDESIVIASWDADFNEDDALHWIKSQTTTSSPTTRTVGIAVREGMFPCERF